MPKEKYDQPSIAGESYSAENFRKKTMINNKKLSTSSKSHTRKISGSFIALKGICSSCPN